MKSWRRFSSSVRPHRSLFGSHAGKQGIQVKVIEKDKERCQLLAAKLKRGLVLCGDGTDIDLLIEEGVSEADVVICLTEDDKLNLLLAQLAKHLGARKTIVRVARNEYIELLS